MTDKMYKNMQAAIKQYDKVVEQNKNLQSELRGVKIGTYNIGHGFTLKGENYEEDGKKYYILEIYKDNKLVYFGEVKLEDK